MEKELALLCLQYLTFECFDSNLSNDDVLRFVKNGSYSFLDYAILHWNHHLETAIDWLDVDDLRHCADLGRALNSFYEIQEPELGEKDKPNQELANRCTKLRTAECYDILVLLLSHAKSGRDAEEQINALGLLGVILSRFRDTLQELSPTLNIGTNQNLKQFYGDHWYKCSRHACFYFHEGFAEEKGLQQHTNRHEKPFCCTEIGCTRMYIGWSTEKELKKHMSQYHPDPEASSWKFPKVNSKQTVFKCDLCPKEFARASILNTHQKRQHTNERPFTCSSCVKSFVTKYDCDRHEKTVHARISVDASDSGEMRTNSTADRSTL